MLLSNYLWQILNSIKQRMTRIKTTFRTFIHLEIVCFMYVVDREHIDKELFNPMTENMIIFIMQHSI